MQLPPRAETKTLLRSVYRVIISQLCEVRGLGRREGGAKIYRSRHIYRLALKPLRASARSNILVGIIELLKDTAEGNLRGGGLRTKRGAKGRSTVFIDPR